MRTYGLLSGKAVKCVSLSVLTAITLFQSGCTSIGPQSVKKDRFDYSTAISDSWKRQVLLNIVKIRYMDNPTFLDVNQIVAGYTLESGVAIGSGGDFNSRGGLDFDFFNLSGTGKYTDRPTITYTPLTGNAYIRSLMTPITPQAIFSTVISGWSADNVLFTALDAINKIKNQQVSNKGAELADPRFMQVLELMSHIQSDGALGMSTRQVENSQVAYMINFGAEGMSAETIEDIAELKKILGLDPQVSEYRLVFRSTAASGREIAVQTRSLLRILTIMAAQVRVPERHVEQGRTLPNVKIPANERFIEVKYSTVRPIDAYVAVLYRKFWFWIDDRDLISKRNFSFVILLFSLVETGGKPAAPLITIPAQ